MLQPGIFLMHHPSAQPAQAASEMMATQQPAPGSACATEISDRVQMATVQRFVSVDVLVTEIQKQLHLPAHGGRRQGGVEPNEFVPQNKTSSLCTPTTEPSGPSWGSGSSAHGCV